MSDIGNSITDIEKTTSDLENSMSDIGNGLYLHFHIGKQDGETVPQEITAVWREMRHLRHPPQKTTTPKAVEPFSLSFDLFKVVPSSPHFRRWRISRHTAVSVCWTASPSLCICACPRACVSAHPTPGGHVGPPLHVLLHPRNTPHINVERCVEKTFVLIL